MKTEAKVTVTTETEVKTELLALAERCEKAAENDPELFEDAFVLCFPRPERVWVTDNTGTWTPEYAEYHERSWRFDGLMEAGAFLDSAMSLVPEGWHLMKMCEGPDETPRSRNFAYDGTGQVILHWVGPRRLIYNLQYGSGSTFALALCAAALRARATLNGGRDGE